MSSYSEFKKELLTDPEVQAAYDELQPEYDTLHGHLTHPADHAVFTELQTS